MLPSAPFPLFGAFVHHGQAVSPVSSVRFFTPRATYQYCLRDAEKPPRLAFCYLTFQIALVGQHHIEMTRSIPYASANERRSL